MEVNTPPVLPGDTEMALKPRCDTNKLSYDSPLCLLSVALMERFTFQILLLALLY